MSGYNVFISPLKVLGIINKGISGYVKWNLTSNQDENVFFGIKVLIDIENELFESTCRTIKFMMTDVNHLEKMWTVLYV